MPKLLEQVRNLIRTRHYSYRTEQTYIHWIKQYIFFHGKRHPAEIGGPEVSEFHPQAIPKSGSLTQNQAWRPTFHHHVLIDLPWLENVERAKVSAP